jgi:hypothetical protein
LPSPVPWRASPSPVLQRASLPPARITFNGHIFFFHFCPSRVEKSTCLSAYSAISSLCFLL